MQDQNNTNQDNSSSARKEDHKEQKESSNRIFEKWKDPENNMGNDVTSEIKIANSGGKMEEGSDQRWHMDENSEKGDEELKQ